MKKLTSILLIAELLLMSSCGAKAQAVKSQSDSTYTQSGKADASDRLTESDYHDVAKELGIDVAIIKAVVEIETGNKHVGFWAPGRPLINFDVNVYRKEAKRQGISLKEVEKDAPMVFEKADVKKYGSQQAGDQARLDAAMKYTPKLALESTFWGMFQIGGFNWKLCGAKSIDDFVKKMSTSERAQLELFAAYCKSRGLVKYLKNKDWEAFSYRYNGPGYKKMKYDTRMAEAYARYSKKK